jgi:hypothetical protein
MRCPDNAQPAIRTLEINEECLVAEICIDRYLWALYERAPKVDAIKVYEQRKVTIKRKGKTRNCHQDLHQACRRGLRLEGSKGR